ncbi:MAG: redoxin domain-containing protein [Crocinitomicaceae bacterium]|nr:redoxin domain-containing protein [Crocinitomicaceae bacterium]
MNRCAIIFFFIIQQVFSFAQLVTEKDVSPSYRVVFFISPSCKICQYYALPFRDFYHNYHADGFRFEAFVPSKQFSEEDVQEFKKKYRIPFSVSKDTMALHNQWDATITPEVFVLNKNDEILYHGRIDDSYQAIGKRRQVVQNHELQSVLDRLAGGETGPFENEPAVGCLIEKY